ncbi:PREDICTED: aluminum-activated malate transporter 2-like [Tarenaya hassleriana]|uniref:aluminum-activated malate transporter 2-like n=1 Tax=Tarenaya hassleriana TaxID=28532 RepID=UPI0008FD2A33|nr:PREDICTED: aluminum-activated malate transporter 2-like [Tarenaya hassleriana]
MERVREKAMEIAREVERVAREDPRRVVHSLKVGLALALVSSFYYYQPLYDNFGVNAMWAVMTVVVVFEFSVGATLGKGLNRGVATLFASALGVGAHHIASISGPTLEPILLAVFVFLHAAISTFIRFFPKVKARYDYGLLIFILTFALVSVSGFRDDEVIELAHKRLSTVGVGGAACVLVSIFICPVWAGQDLHNLIANNLAKVGNFLEEFGDEYFQGAANGDTIHVEKKRENLEGYKSVLSTKSNEESLVGEFREMGTGSRGFQVQASLETISRHWYVDPTVRLSGRCLEFIPQSRYPGINGCKKEIRRAIEKNEF